MNIKVEEIYKGTMYVGYDKYIQQMTDKFKNELDGEDEPFLSITELELIDQAKDLIKQIVENKCNLMKNMHDGRITQDKITVEENLIKTFQEKLDELNMKRFRFLHKNKIREFEEQIKKSKEIISSNSERLEELDNNVAYIISREEELFKDLAYVDKRYGELKES